MYRSKEPFQKLYWPVFDGPFIRCQLWSIVAFQHLRATYKFNYVERVTKTLAGQQTLRPSRDNTVIIIERGIHVYFCYSSSPGFIFITINESFCRQRFKNEVCKYFKNEVCKVCWWRKGGIHVNMFLGNLHTWGYSYRYFVRGIQAMFAYVSIIPL